MEKNGYELKRCNAVKRCKSITNQSKQPVCRYILEKVKKKGKSLTPLSLAMWTGMYPFKYSCLDKVMTFLTRYVNLCNIWTKLGHYSTPWR